MTISNIKTSVSIEKPLFEQAEKLAERMQVSRSRLYSMALEMFIEKCESQQILQQLNQLYEENPPDAEEERLLEAMRGQQRRLVEGEW
ncbi:MAG: hypothetical protein U9R48_08190 [Chloroflexota bacterium]|nr:hypothetical protein [Chloroflexota bacterium]